MITFRYCSGPESKKTHDDGDVSIEVLASRSYAEEEVLNDAVKEYRPQYCWDRLSMSVLPECTGYNIHRAPEPTCVCLRVSIFLR